MGWQRRGMPSLHRTAPAAFSLLHRYCFSPRSDRTTIRNAAAHSSRKRYAPYRKSPQRRHCNRSPRRDTEENSQDRICRRRSHRGHQERKKSAPHIILLRSEKPIAPAAPANHAVSNRRWSMKATPYPQERHTYVIAETSAFHGAQTVKQLVTAVAHDPANRPYPRLPALAHPPLTTTSHAAACLRSSTRKQIRTFAA